MAEIVESDALKRFLSSIPSKFLDAGGKQFAVDEHKIDEEARYDGKWVLTTNTDLTATEVAIKYK